MTGLVIKLKPNEKLLINGIILQNGDRTARLRVRSDDVAVLRASDAIPPEEVKTPLTRIYYIAQLALAGEAEHEESAGQIEKGLSDIAPMFEKTHPEEIKRAISGARERKFFIVMRTLKTLFSYEKVLLEHKGAP